MHIIYHQLEFIDMQYPQKCPKYYIAYDCTDVVHYLVRKQHTFITIYVLRLVVVVDAAIFDTDTRTILPKFLLLIMCTHTYVVLWTYM